MECSDSHTISVLTQFPSCHPVQEGKSHSMASLSSDAVGITRPPSVGALLLLLFSRSVMSDSLRPQGLQHARLPCPSPSPRVCSNSCSSLDSTQPSLLCHPLLFLTPVFPSIRVFSNELSLHIRWPKYWSCSFSFSSSREYSGVISFRID